MNTEYLKEFVVLAETKNFGEASDRLYMNQSTLSKHIKSLENELGINLFLRTTRRVELTNYGQTFLPYFASGLGNGMINMISAAIRQLVLLIPCLWFLIKTLGSTHGWYAFWIAESVACIYINNNGIHGFYYDYNIAQNALTFQRKSDLLSSENK